MSEKQPPSSKPNFDIPPPKIDSAKSDNNQLPRPQLNPIPK